MVTPKLRTILTTRRTGTRFTRRQAAAAIRKVMAERDEATIKLLTPPEERKKVLDARKLRPR
jgi:hypothetical protein